MGVPGGDQGPSLSRGALTGQDIAAKMIFPAKGFVGSVPPKCPPQKEVKIRGPQ